MGGVIEAGAEAVVAVVVVELLPAADEPEPAVALGDARAEDGGDDDGPEAAGGGAATAGADDGGNTGVGLDVDRPADRFNQPVVSTLDWPFTQVKPGPRLTIWTRQAPGE